jgi:hypothetical protein
MKTLLLTTLMWGQMCGYYLRVPSDFSARMRGRVSAVDGSIIYSDGVSKQGDTVCAPWLRSYFPASFDSIAIDSVYLCTSDF